MSESVYRARYWRYGAEQEEECDTLDEALAFLCAGWENGDLSEIAIVGPDGEAILAGADLFNRMVALLGV
ncbi:hypothetical protein [Streptomyces sp. NPDC003720]|uniref:hypothetical protein n=1 Tax=Streptomyces sp. NPDC003720 TaxID=3364684 RepID=UPI003698D8ED